MIQPFHFPENIQIGKTVSITCSVMSGNAPFDFMWYKNGYNLLGESITSTHKKVATLVIDPISKTSGGNYTCVVRNAVGNDSFSAILYVRGKQINV